jgi:aspartate racemase
MAEKLGALSDFLVIASNALHFWKTEIETAAGKAVLSMVDVTIAEVAARKAVKVGLMAIGFTSKHRLYQEPLEALGIDYVVLPDEFVGELDTALFAVMEGREDEGSRRIAHQALEYLRSAGADQIILGCTEVPLLLTDELASTDVINPAEILAQAAVRRAIEHRP